MSDRPVIIECDVCNNKFDVSGIAPGKVIKCGGCKAVLEVPDFEALLRELGTLKLRQSTDSGERPPAEQARAERREPGHRQETTRRRARAETTRRGRPGPSASGDGMSPATIPIIAGIAILVIGCVAGLVAFSGGPTKKKATVAASTEVEADLEAEFLRRYDEAGGDLDLLLRLAEWAGRNEMAGQRTKLLERILNEDPDHESANKALGRVKYEGEWVTKEEKEKRLAAWQAERAPVVEVIGRAIFERKTPRFHIFVQRTGFVEPAKEELEFQRFSSQMDRYFSGWWERKAKDLPGATDGKFSSTEQASLPRLKVVLVTDGGTYNDLCKARNKRAKGQGGFFDKDNGIVWAFHNVLAPHPPFYDSFLFNAFTQPWDEGSGRTADDYVIWRKGLDSFKFLGTDVQVSVSKYFMVALERGAGFSAEKAALSYRGALDALFDNFQDTYPEVIKKRGEMELVPIYIFANRQGYLRYGQKEGKGLLQYAAGHYDPALKIMMCFRPRGRSPITTILHEATHVLMHYLRNNRQKQPTDLFWVQEGIADFYAGAKETPDGRLEVGVVNRGRLMSCKQLYRNPKLLIPLDKLLRYNQTHWVMAVQTRDVRQKQMKMGRIYAQSWLLMHFLHHYQNGKYRERLKKFMAAYIEGKSRYEDFVAAFGEPDISTMSREIAEYVRGL